MIRLAGVLGTLVIFATSLSAQESTYRQGAWGAAGLGAGLVDLECPACLIARNSTSVNGIVRIGGTIHRRWTGGLEFSTWLKSGQGRDARAFVFSFAAFFYPFLDSGLYLNGGAGGLLYRETETGEDISMNGVVFRAGAGYDIFLSPTLALSPFVTYYRSNDMTGKRNRIVFLTQGLSADVLQFGLALVRP